MKWSSFFISCFLMLFCSDTGCVEEKSCCQQKKVYATYFYYMPHNRAILKGISLFNILFKLFATNWCLGPKKSRMF